MAKGVAKDRKHIQRYKTADGAIRFRARLSHDGLRVSQSFASEDQAIRWRNERIDERREGREVKRPAKVRSGRNLVTFVREEYWPAYAKPILAERTRNNYGHIFKRLVSKAPLGRKAPELIDAEDILDWQDWCREQGFTDAEIRTAQKVISGAYTWAAKRPRKTGISGNPISGAGWPSEQRRLTPYIAEALTVERVRREILRSEHGRKRSRIRAALLLSIMAQSGMRPYEARQLQLHDVDLKREVIQLPAEKTKNKRSRVIPLWKPLADDIKRYAKEQKLAASGYLIGGVDDEMPMSFSGWERWRRDFYIPARKSVAKKIKGPQLGKARAYDLCRHSYAAQQIAGLMPLATLASIMGHSVEVLSEVYAAPLEGVEQRQKRGGYEPIDPEHEVIAARRKLAKKSTRA